MHIEMTKDEVLQYAECYAKEPSNVQRDYALRNVPKECDPEWLHILEADKCHNTLLGALRADEWLCKHLQGIAERGCLTRDELKKIARWKYRGGKIRQLIKGNSKDEVREISKVAFAAKSERLRIGALLALQGISWPMASTILHFVFPRCYPILDVNTMEAVGGSTNYNFERWMCYIHLCRDKARHYEVTLRVLDRALWVRGAYLLKAPG